MSANELIDQYQDAMERVIGSRPNISFRFGHFYRLDRSGYVRIRKTTLERIVSAWGK